MSPRLTQALRGTVGEDPSLTSRVLGALLLCGGSLTVLSLLLSDLDVRNASGLYAVGTGAALVGAASIIWARRARPGVVHGVFAAGTGAICLGIYCTGTATGAYAVLFVWLVVIAASFFSTRATVAHFAWILVASGLAINASGSEGISPFARWALGSLLLVVAGTVMSQIVAGRRSVEERLRREVAEKEQLRRELEHLAHHDPLTGLANRRRFGQELTRELARSARRGEPLCVLALDLDRFKAYNDARGHAAGDRLLKRAASTWARGLRDTDLVARMGGDEFVALLPDCDSAEAEHLVQRLGRDFPAGHSFSAGVACWDRAESAAELLSRADTAMYRAKRDGRSAFAPPVRAPG